MTNVFVVVNFDGQPCMAFSTEEKAKAFIQTMHRPRDYDVCEFTVDENISSEPRKASLPTESLRLSDR
jgi:hypothetical protein